jgi:hypothetical protein
LLLPKKPRFSNFVVENKENLVNWSSEKSFFDQDQLFTLWKQRFALVYTVGGKMVPMLVFALNVSLFPIV